MIYVGVPTLNREPEAARCLKAFNDLENPHSVDVNLWQDTEPRALTEINNKILHVSECDITLILADHIVIQEGCVESIENAFADKFPDLDGCVGLSVSNMPPLPGVREYCFLAIGSKFLDRFPMRVAYCPDYYHFFADTELGEYAKSIDKFHYAEEAELYTYHPNANNAGRDSTHRASRKHMGRDIETREERVNRGLLWGDSFERVND